MPKLTPRSIKNIPPPTGSGAREVADSFPGLYLVVQRSGSSSWSIRYRLGDRHQRYTLGKYPAVGPEAARKLAADVLDRVARGEDPQQEKLNARSGEIKDPFGEMAKLFVDQHCRANNRTWRDQARVLSFATERWRDRPVKSISRSDVAELLRDASSGRGPIAANKLRANLSSMFSWLIAESIGELESSPVAGTRPRPSRTRDRVLIPDELSAIWWAAEELSVPFGGFIRLLILTAARRAEVAGMVESEIVGGVWTVPSKRAKTKEPNAIPLPKEALEIIAQLPRISSSGLLFTTTGRTPISGFSKMKQQLDAIVARKTVIAPWGLHDLRRSAATGMSGRGVEPHIIEAILGHRSGVIKGVARTYNRNDFFDAKKKALADWGAYVWMTAVIWG